MDNHRQRKYYCPPSQWGLDPLSDVCHWKNSKRKVKGLRRVAEIYQVTTVAMDTRPTRAYPSSPSYVSSCGLKFPFPLFPFTHVHLHVHYTYTSRIIMYVCRYQRTHMSHMGCQTSVEYALAITILITHVIIKYKLVD